MGIVRKKGGLPVFDTDYLNIIAQLVGKIGANLPAAEGLSV